MYSRIEPDSGAAENGMANGGRACMGHGVETKTSNDASNRLASVNECWQSAEKEIERVWEHDVKY